MLDQHNGTGGFVFDVAWFEENSGVYVAISGEPIHFIVNIYGNRGSPGSPIEGKVIDSSIAALKRRLISPKLT